LLTHGPSAYVDLSRRSRSQERGLVGPPNLGRQQVSPPRQINLWLSVDGARKVKESFEPFELFDMTERQ
jgi:hypothetical protein